MISQAAARLLLAACQRAYAAEVTASPEQERELRHGLASLLKTAIERVEAEAKVNGS